MSTSNRVKFLTRSAVCFIKTRSVTSHHSRSRVVWMDTIDRRYARTHTHTSDHSTVSEPNFWIHSTGLLNLSPLQNFRSFEGLFTRLFVFFCDAGCAPQPVAGLSLSLSTPAAETTGGHPCTTATTTDEPTDRTSHKKIKGAGSFRDPRRMTKAIEGLLAIVPLSSAEGQG